VIGGCNRNYYATILSIFFVLGVMVACDLWITDFLWGNKRTLGGYGWPAGYNLPWRVWVWGNFPTRNQIWGYPRCHIVSMGMGLGSPYPMGIYPLPSWDRSCGYSFFYPEETSSKRVKSFFYSLEKDSVLIKTWFKNLTTALLESGITNNVQQFSNLWKDITNMT
jgi:hypothetical protein